MSTTELKVFIGSRPVLFKSIGLNKSLSLELNVSTLYNIVRPSNS